LQITDAVVVEAGMATKMTIVLEDDL